MEGSEDLGPSEHDTTLLDDPDEEEGVVVDGGEDVEEETGDAVHLFTASKDGESISGPPPSETSWARNSPRSTSPH
jgi:hypothetical protein